MTILYKELTEKQRHQLSSITMLVGIAVMPMSLSLLATTFYIRFVVDDELDLVQGMNTATLPYFLAVTGTINFLAMLFLLSSLAQTHYASHRQQAMTMAFVAIIIALISTVLVFVACIFCFVQLALLPSAFEKGLDSAMQRYSKEPKVKTHLDVLHMDYECCGDESFRDWFTVPWISRDFLVADPQEVQKKVMEGYDYTNDDVPFSCCNPASPRPCIHHHVTINHLHYDYDHHQKTTLYTTGCREALMHFFGHIILRSVALSLLFMFLAQMGIIVASRLMQTSMAQAVRTGDITATTEGYIFKARQGLGGPEQHALLPGAGDAYGQTDTEGDTTDDQYATAPSSEDDVYADTTDGEPIYENIIPEVVEDDYIEPPEVPPDAPFSELYPDELSEPEGHFGGQFQNPGGGGYQDDGLYEEPLFPSEMAENRGRHNSAAGGNNSASTQDGRRRSCTGNIEDRRRSLTGGIQDGRRSCTDNIQDRKKA